MTDAGPEQQQKSLEQVRQEAALWLARLQLETADREAFERWRAEHPAHALEFARAVAHWQALSDVVTAEDVPVPPRAMTRRHLLKIAGGGAALALGCGFLASRSYAWTRAETGVGEFRKISLPDTSVVELNTDTAIAWRFDRRGRAIRLDRGEIAITLRPGIPALLLGRTPLATLQAGQYNVRSLADAMRVTVMQGLVSVENAQGQPQATPTVATAHQQITLAADRRVRIASDLDLDATTAWQNGAIIFRDVPLEEAVAEYNRYLNKKIVIAASDVRLQRVGGRFTNTDPHTFLQAVSMGLRLRVTESDREYVIAR